MSFIGKIDARENFLDILSFTEKLNSNDYQLKSLVNKTKEDYKKRILYANSKELYLDTDIYSRNIRKNKRNKTRAFDLVKSQKLLKRGSVQMKIEKFNKKSHSIGNINMLLKSDKSLNKKIIKNIGSNFFIEEQNEKENENEIKNEKETELFNSEKIGKRKKFDKLDNLKSILELIDVHEKIQYDLIDEKEKLNLNMIRGKKKFQLFQPCITYQKNNLIYNKKYKLIYDRVNSINNIFPLIKKNQKKFI